MGILFGPVPSRRLGRSLGVDLLPYKTCTFDCIYCELGPTNCLTTHRQIFIEPDHIIQELKRYLAQLKEKVDFITLAGSGEPTLHENLGEIIQRIKKTTTIPIAILTNSSLLSQPKVRRELLHLDLIVPSLDAVSQDIFTKINLPSKSIQTTAIIEGLIALRQEFRGQIWLEILFCKGINDTPSELKLLKNAIFRINPDRIQLNTVYRPPSVPGILPLSRERIVKIADLFGEKAEIV